MRAEHMLAAAGKAAHCVMITSSRSATVMFHNQWLIKLEPIGRLHLTTPQTTMPVPCPSLHSHLLLIPFPHLFLLPPTLPHTFAI